MSAATISFMFVLQVNTKNFSSQYQICIKPFDSLLILEKQSKKTINGKKIVPGYY